MKAPVLGRELELLRANGSEPVPQEVAAFCSLYTLGAVIGQLRHVGMTDAEIRDVVELALEAPPSEPPMARPRAHLRPVR